MWSKGTKGGKGRGGKGKGGGRGGGRGKGGGKGSGKGGGPIRRSESVLGEWAWSAEEDAELTQHWAGRPWVHGAPAPGSDDDSSFCVMSWNVLSHGAHRGESTAQWRTRRQRLVRRIQSLAPSILMLQEVQLRPVNHAEWFIEQLRAFGFDGRFNRLAHGTSTVVVCWKSSAWEVRAVQSAFQDAQALEVLSEPLPGPVRALPLKRRAIFVRLKHRLATRSDGTPMELVACSAHLSVPLETPPTSGEDDRRDQTAAEYLPALEAFALRRELDRFASMGAGMDSTVAVVLGADMNSKPEDAARELLSTAGLCEDTAKRLVQQADTNGRTLPTKPLAACSAGRGTAAPLTLTSAYPAVLGREPRYTTINAAGRFCETIDYLMGSPDLQPVSALDVYDCDWHDGDTSGAAGWTRSWHGQPLLPILPNAVEASDHLALCVQYRFEANVPGGAGAAAVAEEHPQKRQCVGWDDGAAAAVAAAQTDNPFGGGDPFGCSSARNFPRFKF